ncbi:MAG: preprotein translocase subunit SecY, partial [Eubacteriales bacterium]|nr:preprotein translocase subunit SecY [Eubacteriales bacterium]
MSGMLDILRNGWRIKELRRKILFTVLMLLIFRIGSFIPVPFLDPDKFESLVGTGSLFDFLNIVSGGAFQNATIFAMSITPYINSSIIMNLLTVAIPKLEKLAKEGEEGKKKIANYTRIGTVILAFLQATLLYSGMKGSIIGGSNVLSYITITLTFTAGTAFLMWLGEQITEKGIGNGISLIIFAGILSRGPATMAILYQYYTAGTFGKGIIGIIAVIVILLVFLAMIALVIWVQEAERRIPVQYAKRVVGRKLYGGQSTHLPIKINLAGVMPIIFAMSIMAFPSTLAGLISPNSTSKFVQWFQNLPNTVWYSVINAVLILFFTFFYTMISFNPVEVANNIKKNGGFVPGIRPGKPTSDYITKVLNRITWFGGFFLAAVTVLPSLLGFILKTPGLWMGGTSLLILV